MDRIDGRPQTAVQESPHTYHVIRESPDDEQFLFLLLLQLVSAVLFARLSDQFLDQLHLRLSLFPRQISLEVEAGGVLGDGQEDKADARDEPDILHLHSGRSRCSLTAETLKLKLTRVFGALHSPIPSLSLSLLGVRVGPENDEK